MIDMDLKSANVVLLEENSAIRRLVKSTLLGIGFGTVNECGTAEAARRIVESTESDLLIVDLDHEGEAVCAIINDIRHARVGNNPFVTIIGLSHNPAEEVIEKVLDAGTDDLVRKPISTKLLSERITNLIQNRKDFVATSDYVGPQRSKGVRPETENAAKVEVPNRLRDKVYGNKRRDGAGKIDEGAIQRAAEAVNLQRLSGLVLLIINKSAQLEGAIAGGASSVDIVEDVSRLSHLVSEAKRIRLSQGVHDTSQLNASMARVMTAISESPAPSVRQVEVLRLHAQAIAATTRGDTTAAGKVVSAFNEVTPSEPQSVAAD
ncbi:MAG: response regulator [Alphaproteobacteria bacterium]